MDYYTLCNHLIKAINTIQEQRPESIKIALAKPHSDLLVNNLRNTIKMAGLTYIDRPGSLRFMGIEIQPYPYIDHFLVFDPNNAWMHPQLCVKHIFPIL